MRPFHGPYGLDVLCLHDPRIGSGCSMTSPQVILEVIMYGDDCPTPLALVFRLLLFSCRSSDLPYKIQYPQLRILT